MTTEELNQFLYQNIPMTKLMGLKLLEFNEQELITTAPLEININDKGTGFGGSLSMMTIISSWSLCRLLAEQLNIKQSEIVIVKNETKFLKPVTKDFICRVQNISQEQFEKLDQKITRKKRGSISIRATIEENSEVCVEFEGLYFIKSMD